MLCKVHDSWGVKPEDGADEILANANRRKNSTKKNLSDADGHFCSCAARGLAIGSVPVFVRGQLLLQRLT